MKYIFGVLLVTFSPQVLVFSLLLLPFKISHLWVTLPIIEWVGVIGITMEIIGFLLLLKYKLRNFEFPEYKSWEKENSIDVKELKKSGNYKKQNFRWSEMGSNMVTALTDYPISQKFIQLWYLKTRGPIFLVVIGLVFQIVQIVFT